ncbi:beta-fructofuranosidase [Thalassobacillus cyri]|uniref:Sucrose-6-phosphate hydrolase n=1 Tax=Thalassobacillus cyri TaxID=571932 RepID=A0A1H3VW80_9BACI|nr:sucrose-6-phosphate hydrolase [Thalassobacillus cyri]SDZ79056.1 beta-fructofuranosidase [Thalassobacillus cyri]
MPAKHQNDIRRQADEFIAKQKGKVSSHPWYLQYHVMPQAGWMNDPNGFSYFNGEYHLFYQHHPYDPTWGPMYWGHVKSKDLVHWEHLPVALAPDEEYDRDGCFSGSAIEKDGKHVLLYTGNVWTERDEDDNLIQVQATAVSEDGIYYEKPGDNPVIASAPEGDIHPLHFRDPKVWQHEDDYYMVLGSKTKANTGQVLLYRSPDLLEWEFVAVMAKGEGNFGFMWECPDLFDLDGKDVLVMSPQGVEPEGDAYHNLHQSGYVIGNLDYATGKLDYGAFHMLDHGFDFYAPQTTMDEKGRRILIAWMDMWESEMPTQNAGYAGAMTIPRVVTRKADKLYITPLPELKNLRENMVAHQQVKVEGETSLPEVAGDCIELEMTLDTSQASEFGIKLRVDKAAGQETVLQFNKDTGLVILDRNNSGEGPGGVRKASLEITDLLDVQIFIDKSSVEIFLNGGERVMTTRIYPTEQAKGVSFFTDKSLTLVSLKKWDLKQAIK